MDLTQLVERQPPRPWTGTSKLPWHDPDFSERMLAEHLNPAHSAASRQPIIIDRQVDWIHRQILGARPQRILELGCGPGFYLERLARLGHRCRGIDFSPAAIAHAGYRADRYRLPVDYVRADMRDGDYGSDLDAALLLFGEFNAFAAADMAAILEHAKSSLRPGGLLIVEPHTFEYVRHIGHRPANWFTATNSVFSDRPHLCLHECHWHQHDQATTERYWIVDQETGLTETYVNTLQAYHKPQCEAILQEAGFKVSSYPSLTGRSDPDQAGLFVLVGEA